ncbi:MAG: DUF58 domain-containing protein [Aureliella sp.]
MPPNDQPKRDAILTPEQRRLVAQLQLSAKKTLASISSGRHRSQARGTSAEFKEHRQYVPGDALRLLDWKLFGKTDRLFIRQYENETSLRTLLLVDQSGSMQHTSSGKGAISKHQFAIRLAACVATLATQQQDPIGLVTFDSEVRNFIPARNRPSHLAQIFAGLVNSTPSRRTAVATAIAQLAPRIRSRGSVIVVISDLLDDPESILESLKLLDVSGHEVIVFQVLNDSEREFPFRQQTEFVSLEQPTERVKLDARKYRKRYLESVAAFHEKTQAGLAQSRIDLVQCSTNDDQAELLTRYLAVRNRTSRGTR